MEIEVLPRSHTRLDRSSLSGGRQLGRQTDRRAGRHEGRQVGPGQARPESAVVYCNSLIMVRTNVGRLPRRPVVMSGWHSPRPAACAVSC